MCIRDRSDGNHLLGRTRPVFALAHVLDLFAYIFTCLRRWRFGFSHLSGSFLLWQGYSPPPPRSVFTFGLPNMEWRRSTGTPPIPQVVSAISGHLLLSKPGAFSSFVLSTSRMKHFLSSCTLSSRDGTANSLFPMPRTPPKDSTA